MAGRGTDIALGEGVKELGGLHIIGTERHESRRIDNQLRGRSGRQGDPGSSRFYLSLEDELMRLFGSERIASIMERLGVDENEPIEHGIISRQIENAQKKVESVNFERRKHILKYDDVNNTQREVIYTRRDHILYSEDLERDFLSMVEDALYDIVEPYTQSQYPEDWDLDSIKREAMDRLVVYHSFDGIERETMTLNDVIEALKKSVELAFHEKKVLIDRIPEEPFTALFGRVHEASAESTRSCALSCCARSNEIGWIICKPWIC
jgi:preprotein translocase subunit SecA